MTCSVDELPSFPFLKAAAIRKLLASWAVPVTNTGAGERLVLWGKSGKKAPFAEELGKKDIAHRVRPLPFGFFGICGCLSPVSPVRLFANTSVFLAKVSIENSSFMLW